MNLFLNSPRVGCSSAVVTHKKMQHLSRISGLTAPYFGFHGLYKALITASRPCSSVAAFQTDQYVGASAPTIRTIPYDVRYENRVHLSGILGADFKMHSTPFGPIARAPLYVKSSKQEKDTLFNVELYEALAQAAMPALASGSYVHVAGRLRCDEYVDKTNTKRMNIVVEADEVALVDNTLPPQQSEAFQLPTGFSPQQSQQIQQAAWGQQQQAAQSSWQQQDRPAPARIPFTRLGPEEERELWAELERDRTQFWDNRVGKRNPKAPDYKHKSTGHGLWLSSRNAPDWAAEELRELS